MFLIAFLSESWFLFRNQEYSFACTVLCTVAYTEEYVSLSTAFVQHCIVVCTFMWTDLMWYAEAPELFNTAVFEKCDAADNSCWQYLPANSSWSGSRQRAIGRFCLTNLRSVFDQLFNQLVCCRCGWEDVQLVFEQFGQCWSCAIAQCSLDSLT